MSDDKNPEEKPSFFDPADEARSWPPSEDYEVEESVPDSDLGFLAEGESSLEASSEPDALDELFAEEAESTEADFVKEEKIEADITDQPSGDYMDMLMQDFTTFDDAEEDQAATEEFLQPLEPSPVEEAQVVEEELESEQQAEAEIEELVEAVEEVIPEPQLTEPQAVSDKVLIVDDEDDAIDELLVADSSTEDSSEEDTIDEIFNVSNDIIQEEAEDNLDDLIDEVAAEEDEQVSDLAAVTTSALASDNAQVEDDDIDDFLSEADEEVKPFRTFSKFDYDEITGGDEVEEEEEAAGILAGVDRNVLIVIGVALALLIYFLFNNVMNRTYEAKSRRKSRPPKKEARVQVRNKELVPIWEIAAQKGKSYAEEMRLVKTIYKGAGRDNPFSMPESILKDLREAAELARLKKQKPNTYRRLAYRATLVGVLTAKDSTIALVNMQEASFDVLEATERDKILKLATKTMDKSKKNTLEMVEGSYIGPWEIIEIEAPKGAFNDAKLTIKYENQVKILSMGKAEELGIFTEGGLMDDLEEPVGGELDNPDSEIFED